MSKSEIGFTFKKGNDTLTVRLRKSQIEYLRNDELVKIKEVKPEFTSKNLKEHAEKVAESMGVSTDQIQTS